jgi:hypothetical protein
MQYLSLGSSVFLDICVQMMRLGIMDRRYEVAF